jgi:uncharacterized protein
MPISDTHGLLRPEALAALRGVGRIIHAGDIGKLQILTELAKIAPVKAVRGNNDQSPWARSIRDREILDIAGHRILVVHDLSALDADPAAAGVAAVISGHSHKAKSERRNGVLFLNPGSAGPRRFNLPVSLALLRISAGKMQAEIVELPI